MIAVWLESSKIFLIVNVYVFRYWKYVHKLEPVKDRILELQAWLSLNFVIFTLCLLWMYYNWGTVGIILHKIHFWIFISSYLLCSIISSFEFGSSIFCFSYALAPLNWQLNKMLRFLTYLRVTTWDSRNWSCSTCFFFLFSAFVYNSNDIIRYGNFFLLYFPECARLQYSLAHDINKSLLVGWWGKNENKLLNTQNVRKSRDEGRRGGYSLRRINNFVFR